MSLFYQTGNNTHDRERFETASYPGHLLTSQNMQKHSQMMETLNAGFDTPKTFTNILDKSKVKFSPQFSLPTQMPKSAHSEEVVEVDHSNLVEQQKYRDDMGTLRPDSQEYNSVIPNHDYVYSFLAEFEKDLSDDDMISI